MNEGPNHDHSMPSALAVPCGPKRNSTQALGFNTDHKIKPGQMACAHGVEGLDRTQWVPTHLACFISYEDLHDIAFKERPWWPGLTGRVAQAMLSFGCTARLLQLSPSPSLKTVGFVRYAEGVPGGCNGRCRAR
jgi:hypothetical protein